MTFCEDQVEQWCIIRGKPAEYFGSNVVGHIPVHDCCSIVPLFLNSTDIVLHSAISKPFHFGCSWLYSRNVSHSQKHNLIFFTLIYDINYVYRINRYLFPLLVWGL